MNAFERFTEFEEHLLEDEKPSEYFCSLLGETWFRTQKPFKLLRELQLVDQSPKHHPEGNVFLHTMMVVDNAAQRKERSKDKRALMWAALLHDLGKATTTKVRNGRITAYDHDKAGEGLALDFLRTCLSDAEANEHKKLHEQEEFIKKVAKLVRWHMQILFANKNQKFLNLNLMLQETDYQEIALLGLCDRLGRGGLDAEKVNEIEESISQFLQKSEDFENSGKL